MYQLFYCLGRNVEVAPRTRTIAGVDIISVGSHSIYTFRCSKSIYAYTLSMDPWWSHRQVQTDANVESDTEASHNAQKTKEWTKGMNMKELWHVAM